MIKVQAIFRQLWTLTLLAAMFLFTSGILLAQEHPEHPTKSAKQVKSEHPEHPSEAVKVDVEMMVNAITSHINGDAKLKGGYYLVLDPKTDAPLQLTLDKVHKERLSKVGDNLYFACTDLKDKGGKIYDLDFFMTEEDGKLVCTEVMVHKEDGQARYSWFESGGVWKRR